MAQARGSLDTYRKKRDFRSTPEPKGRKARRRGHAYSMQKHDATRLHYDLRLELDGVLLSWAVTRGPSMNPSDKRLAVRTEDHPVDYRDFEGVIPEGYGAGTVMLWDEGEWQPQGDPHEGLDDGVFKFTLQGKRLKGGFALVRMKPRKQEKRENWLLVKERDRYADPDRPPTERWTGSVKTGRGFDEISAGKGEKGGKSGKRVKLAFVSPQLATLRDSPPDGDDWLHEVKFDGYRMQALIGDGKARLLTRNAKDWTGRYPKVARALAGFNTGGTIFDGEIVAVDGGGRSSFRALQNAVPEGDAEIRYYVFDLLQHDGTDWRKRPLRDRKAELEAVVDAIGPPVFYSDHVEGDGDEIIARACSMHLEGIVSKQADAAYRSGRGTAWIKSKCVNNDEFVIVGYRRSSKRGRPFASLLLGEYDGGKLVYRGRVGTGFDESTFNELSSAMKPLARKTSPLVATPAEAKREAVWLTPKLVAQVAYTEQTGDGRLRHPSFLGLREDKPAKEVKAMAREADDAAAEFRGVRVTHPDRVMFPDQGATKRAIAAYYDDNAERVLRFLAGRPLSLVRCPQGRDGQCFFQKHHNASVPEHIGSVMIEEKQGTRSPYLVINDAAGLIAATQLGGLELHIWGARADMLERPERVVFDLDPDTSLDFADVKAAAYELRDVLAAAELQSFALLTGGKGIHVVVPVERRRDWADVKTFARGLAVKLAAAEPGRYLAEASKAKRQGRIFIDWLRNERGSTAIAPYSLRARPGAPVATPVTWDELARIDSAATYTLDNIARRLSQLGSDPWDGYDDARQSITAAHLRSVDGD